MSFFWKLVEMDLRRRPHKSHAGIRLYVDEYDLDSREVVAVEKAIDLISDTDALLHKRLTTMVSAIFIRKLFKTAAMYKIGFIVLNLQAADLWWRGELVQSVAALLVHELTHFRIRRFCKRFSNDRESRAREEIICLGQELLFCEKLGSPPQDYIACVRKALEDQKRIEEGAKLHPAICLRTPRVKPPNNTPRMGNREWGYPLKLK